MLKFVNKEHLFENLTEAHYRFQTQIDASQYPQVHDFYETILVTSGILYLKLCEERLSLQTGSLLLIRPGDIHSKFGSDCTHINLAFPAEAVDALFEYLCDKETKELLSVPVFIPPTHLSSQTFAALKAKMNLLNTIGTSECHKTRTVLRSILFEVIAQHIFPSLFSNSGHSNLPGWFSDSLQAWQTIEHRQKGLDFFCQDTGYTKEYLCRCFKRYLGISASAYLNQQRLNYAANLLLHSDYSVTDIIYEAGFKSASCFYHVFRETYEMSPKQFCTQHNKWNSNPSAKL